MAAPILNGVSLCRFSSRYAHNAPIGIHAAHTPNGVIQLGSGYRLIDVALSAKCTMLETPPTATAIFTTLNRVNRMSGVLLRRVAGTAGAMRTSFRVNQAMTTAAVCAAVNAADIRSAPRAVIPAVTMRKAMMER